MAIFHESDAASAGSKNKLLPIIIVVIVAVILLCCCCVAVLIILIATGTITSSKVEDITSQGNFLPLYLTLRTWL